MRKQEELSLSLRFELWVLWDRICVEHFGRARAPVVGLVKTDDLTSVGAALALWLWGGWIFIGLALKGHPFFTEHLEPYFTIGWLVALAVGLGSALFREKDPMGEKLLAEITKCQRYNADLRLLGTAFNVDLSSGLYRELNGWPVEDTKRPPPRYPSGSKSRCASELRPTIFEPDETRAMTIGDYNRVLTRESHNPHMVSPSEIGLPGAFITPLMVKEQLEQRILERYPNIVVEQKNKIIRIDTTGLKLLYAPPRNVLNVSD